MAEARLRFAKGSGDSERARQNLMAFSNGVRACLGRNLALVEMHLVLANLLRDYDLRLPGDELGSGVPDSQSTTAPGVIPSIPHKTLMTLNPTDPDCDYRVLVSRARYTVVTQE